MNPDFDPRVWDRLQARASAQLRPAFADRVLRAARSAAEAAPSLLGQLAVCAATAAFCFVAVAVVHTAKVRVQSSRSLADWQVIAPATDDPGQ
jgi:hypothetical protein